MRDTHTPLETPISLRGEELQLIEEAVSGDAIALQALLLAHRPRLRSYVLRKLPTAIRDADVDDILQETSAEAFRYIRTFVAEGPDAFGRWLLTIARNHMSGMLRKALRLKRGGDLRREEGGAEGVIALLDSLAVYHRTPSRSAVAHELAGAVQQSISRLPPDWSQAIRLRHLDGLPVKDAAARMHRSENAFHQLCHRALDRLRDDLRSRSFFV